MCETQGQCPEWLHQGCSRRGERDIERPLIRGGGAAWRGREGAMSKAACSLVASLW